jgi:hypothetical protein
MTTMTIDRNRTPAALERDPAFAARVTLAWAMAGGLLAGGYFVAFMTLAQRLNANALLVTATGLFILGAGVGGLFGAVLGWAGRPRDVTRDELLRGLLRTALLAVPALGFAFLAAAWVAMTVVVLYAGRMLPMAFAFGAWLTGAAVVLWAATEAADAVANALRRR